MTNWNCTSDPKHVEENEEMAKLVNEMDEKVKETPYFSSPDEWEDLLKEVSNVLHPSENFDFLIKSSHRLAALLPSFQTTTSAWT